MAYSTFDALSWFIKHTGRFRGKGRITNYWMKIRPKSEQRLRVLPGGGSVLCDLSVPYEVMVWFEAEEQNDLLLLQKLLKPGQIFLDCGANIGIWTITAAACVGSTGKVYAFEPNPATFKKLKANIELNEWQNICLVPKAVGNGEQTLFFKAAEAHNTSQIVPDLAADTISVAQTRVDTFLEDEVVHFIKIDVEGFELPVLMGGERILKTQHPQICVEFNTILTRVSTLGKWEVHQYLTELGYKAYRFEDALNLSAQKALAAEWQTTGYCNLYYTV